MATIPEGFFGTLSKVEIEHLSPFLAAEVCLKKLCWSLIKLGRQVSQPLTLELMRASRVGQSIGYLPVRSVPKFVCDRAFLHGRA